MRQLDVLMTERLKKPEWTADADQDRCTKLPVRFAAKKIWFRFSPEETDQFIAQNTLESKGIREENLLLRHRKRHQNQSQNLKLKFKFI